MGKTGKSSSKKPADKKKNSKLLTWREKLEKYDINSICLKFVPNVMIMAELSTDFSAAIDIFYHGAQTCSTNVLSLNWGNFVEHLKKPVAPTRISTSGLKDDYASTYKAATDEARKYLLSGPSLGNSIPSELCAKLIKLEIIKMIISYSVINKQKESSLGSEKIKGKKRVNTTKESPKESICVEKEELYVLIIGCYDPYVVKELFKCGVILSAIIEIAYSHTVFHGIECREYTSTSTSSADTISEIVELQLDPGVMLHMNSGNRRITEYSILSSVISNDPSDLTSSSSNVDSKGRVICYFWTILYKQIDGEHLSTFLSNTPHLRISPIYAAAPKEGTLDYELEASELFAHVCREIMKLVDAKRQHANYLRHMKIYNFDLPPQKMSTHSFTVYKKVVNSVPPECVTVDLILHGVVEEICNRLPDAVKSPSKGDKSTSSKMAKEPHSSIEVRKSLISQTPSSLNASRHSKTKSPCKGPCRKSTSSKMAEEPHSSTEVRKSLISQTRSSLNASRHSKTKSPCKGVCRKSTKSKMAEEPHSSTEVRKSLISQTLSSLNASRQSKTNTLSRESKTISHVSLTRGSQSISKEKSNRKQILLKKLANKLILYRRNYGPFNRTAFLHHEECWNDPRTKIKLSKKKFTIHESSLLELETLCFSRLPQDVRKIYTKGLLRCPVARLWQHCKGVNAAQIYVKNHLMQELSARFHLPTDEVTTAMNLIFFNSLICLGGNTIPNKLSKPTCDYVFCSNWKVDELQLMDIFKACISDSDLVSMRCNMRNEEICVKIPHLDMIKTLNVYETTYIPSYLWYERLLPVVALQQLKKAYLDYVCVDTEFCPFTDCILLHFHNDVDSFGIKSKTWNQSIRTPVCLRDFCKYVMHDEAIWLKEQEEKYKSELNGNVQLDKAHLPNHPSTSKNSSKCENRYNFYGFDYGTSRLQLTGATTIFHSLDGYKVTVDKTTILGQPRKISINVTIKDHSFIVHYIDKKRTPKEPFMCHIVLADGTIIVFNKPPKINNRGLIIGELIKKRKKRKVKINPNSIYRPRDKNFFYTVDMRICDKNYFQSENLIDSSKNSAVAIYRIVPSHLTGLIDSKHNPTIKFVTKGQSLVAVGDAVTPIDKEACNCYKYNTFPKNYVNLCQPSTDDFFKNVPIPSPDQSDLKINKDSKPSLNGNDNASVEECVMQPFEPWTYQHMYDTSLFDKISPAEQKTFERISIPDDNLRPIASHLSISYDSLVLNKAKQMEVFPLDFTGLHSTLTPSTPICTSPSTTTIQVFSDMSESNNISTHSLEVDKKFEELVLRLRALSYGDDVPVNPEDVSDSSSECCTSMEIRQSTVFCQIKLNHEIFPSLTNIEKGEIEFFPLDMSSPRYGASYSDSGRPLICRTSQKAFEVNNSATTSHDLLSQHTENKLTTLDLTHAPLTRCTPCIKRLLLKIEEGKQQQIPLFKILSSKLHKFVYSKRIKSHVHIQVGKNIIKLLCKHPSYKLKKIVKVTKMLPKKVSNAKFANKQFYDMKLSLPTGLLIYTTPGVNKGPFNIKQQYLHKGPQTKAVVGEESRAFMRSGHLVIRKCDGTIHILSTNGQIIQCELPHRIEQTYVKYSINRNKSVRSGENNYVLPRFKRKVRRLVCHLQKHVIGGKYKCYYVYPKRSRRYNKSKCTFRATKDPLKFILIADDGRTSTITGTKISYKEKIFQSTHECRDRDGYQEFFYTRDDGVKCLLTENGVLTTEFYDKTRISTWYTIEPEMIGINEPDVSSWEAKASAGSSLLTSSQESFILKRYLQSINLQQNGWVSVNIVYKFEHPNYATVIYSRLDHRTKIILPNNTIITASGKGFYAINIDGVIRARINNDHINIESNLCQNCSQSSVTAINVKPMYENRHPIPENTRLLKTYDSYNKTFIVNYDGTYCRNSDFINSHSNRIGCKVHSKEDCEKLYVLNKDLSAIKFWDIKAYQRRMTEATKCKNSIVEFYDKIGNGSKMYHYFQIRKYMFKPYPARFTTLYEYDYLIPSRFQRSVRPSSAYCLTLEIHSLSAAITSELLQGLVCRLHSYQRHQKFRNAAVLESYLKIVLEEFSLPRKELDMEFTAIVKNNNAVMAGPGFYQEFTYVTARDVLKPVPLHTELKKCPKVYHLPQIHIEETARQLYTPVHMADKSVQCGCGCDPIVTNKFRWDMLGLKRPKNMYFKPGGQKTEAEEVTMEQREDKVQLMTHLRQLSDNPEKKTEAITCYIENCLAKQKKMSANLGISVMENGYLKCKKCMPPVTFKKQQNIPLKNKPLKSTKPNEQKPSGGRELSTQKPNHKQYKTRNSETQKTTTTQQCRCHQLKLQHFTKTRQSTTQKSNVHMTVYYQPNGQPPPSKEFLKFILTADQPWVRQSTSVEQPTTQNTYAVRQPAKKKKKTCQRRPTGKK